MAEHNRLGKRGEDIAALYLEERGYVVCCRNWRSGHLEIDIVAVKDGETVIVEVKTRSSVLYGPPEDGLTRRKMERLTRAADAYIVENDVYGSVRFDLITVVEDRRRGVGPSVNHIANVFFPELKTY